MKPWRNQAPMFIPTGPGMGEMFPLLHTRPRARGTERDRAALGMVSALHNI